MSDSIKDEAREILASLEEDIANATGGGASDIAKIHARLSAIEAALKVLLHALAEDD